jgi:hypothetical protein
MLDTHDTLRPVGYAVRSVLVEAMQEIARLAAVLEGEEPTK